MRVFDTHLHIDEKLGLVKGMQAVSEGLKEAGIERGLLLHLKTQGWHMREVALEVAKYDNVKAFVNVDPRSPTAREEMHEAIKELGYLGLKVHPRLLEHDLHGPEIKKLIGIADELSVPVLIDAFPDGTHLMQGFDLNRYCDLAKEFPRVKFIWAHMGGHYVLDFMMAAKRLPNVYFDTSYSLLYYRGSSIPQNMVYAITSMRGERVFYGSDYPDRGLKETLEQSLRVFREFGLVEEFQNKVLHGNARAFFGW